MRFLQILDLRFLVITDESIYKTFCLESRPMLLKLCLPRTILSTEILEPLFEMTPNLVHLCTTNINESCIEVSKYHFKYLLLIYFKWKYKLYFMLPIIIIFFRKLLRNSKNLIFFVVTTNVLKKREKLFRCSCKMRKWVIFEIIYIIHYLINELLLVF